MKKSNKLALGLFLIYLAAVAYCCFGSFDGIQQVSPSLLGIPTDKIIHFIMFFPCVTFPSTVTPTGHGRPCCWPG